MERTEAKVTLRGDDWTLWTEDREVIATSMSKSSVLQWARTYGYEVVHDWSDEPEPETEVIEKTTEEG